ncbi:hypothetical protein [Nocardia sp. NPDC005998]|uniref:hypothetical protein n=1 Tax=Nocardia sp. NPDC005998 TaxID=3156894 RepID=UPI0033A04ED4
MNRFHGSGAADVDLDQAVAGSRCHRNRRYLSARSGELRLFPVNGGKYGVHIELFHENSQRVARPTDRNAGPRADHIIVG